MDNERGISFENPQNPENSKKKKDNTRLFLSETFEQDKYSARESHSEGIFNIIN